jgi:hypothetical protein
MDMNTFDYTPSLCSMRLEAFQFQWQPRVFLRIVGRDEAGALADDLPVWERRYAQHTEGLLLDETLGDEIYVSGESVSELPRLHT